jgi:hypothetical protein
MENPRLSVQKSIDTDRPDIEAMDRGAYRWVVDA